MYVIREYFLVLTRSKQKTSIVDIGNCNLIFTTPEARSNADKF